MAYLELGSMYIFLLHCLFIVSVRYISDVGPTQDFIVGTI